MAKVMVIAGGAWQTPIVKKAKSLGHTVICSNLYADSPAFEYADFGEVANVLDKEKNLEIARKYNIDAVITDQSDIAVPTVAYIASKMNLIGIGIENADLFTNKFQMREYCKENGFTYPLYKLCHSKDDVRAFLGNLKKIIIKPIDSQSSRGVHIITSESDIDKYYDDCISYSNREKAILAEQYIDGVEFTVDGLKTQNDYVVTAISKKKHFDYNPSVAKELLFTYNDSEFDYDELRNLNRRMILESGLSFGLTHSEYKYMDGKFYLIEMAARGGGTRISSDITTIMSGIDENEALIKLSLGEPFDVKSECTDNICSILGFFDFKAGKVKNVAGINEAAQKTGVHALGLDIKAGDIIENAQDDRSRCGYYIIKANSLAELRNIEEDVKRTVVVEYEG